MFPASMMVPLNNKTGGPETITPPATSQTTIVEICHVLSAILSSGIVLINSGIVICFVAQWIRNPSKTRLNTAGLLVLNLLVSDAAVGTVAIHVVLVPFDKTNSSRYGCVSRIAAIYLLRTASHTAMINVAIDRYIAIVHTLQYRVWVTIKRTIAVMLIGWILPLIGTGYGFLSNDWQPEVKFCGDMKSSQIFLRYVQVPSQVVALLCIVFILCRVYIRLKKHNISLASNNAFRNYGRKSARVLLYVTSTYLICWVPFTALLVFASAPRYAYPITFNVSLTLAYSSFLINPIIFSYRTENIRKPVSELCAALSKIATCTKKTMSANDRNTPYVISTANQGRCSSFTTTSSMVSSECHNEDSTEVAVYT